MLRSCPAALEELAALFNALAPGQGGRAYLLQPGAGTIPVLQQMLASEGRRAGCADGRLQQQALAALQKLSLHRGHRARCCARGCWSGRALACCRWGGPASASAPAAALLWPAQRVWPRARAANLAGWLAAPTGPRACLARRAPPPRAGRRSAAPPWSLARRRCSTSLALRSEGRARCGALAGPLLALCEGRELAAARGLGHLLQAGGGGGLTACLPACLLAGWLRIRYDRVTLACQWPGQLSWTVQLSAPA
jgi:hypothetical protein